MSSTTAGRASPTAIPDSIGLPKVRGYWGTVGYRLRYDYVTIFFGLVLLAIVLLAVAAPAVMAGGVVQITCWSGVRSGPSLTAPSPG